MRKVFLPAVVVWIATIWAAAQTANTYLPLLKAQENLQLAKAKMLDLDYKGAAKALRAAADGLLAYQKISPGPHGTDAALMAREIRTLARNTRQDPDYLKLKVEDWQAKVTAWDKAAPK